MPSAFDCHDMFSGFDCKIRLNSHDVYGAQPGGWVIDFDGGSTDRLQSMYEIHASGSMVIGVSYPSSGAILGRVFYRQSSGSWGYLYTGIVCDSFGDVPVCQIHSGDVYVSYDDPTTVQGRIGKITSGALGVEVTSTQLQGLSLTRDEGKLYWMQYKRDIGSGTGCVGPAPWTWGAINSGVRRNKFSEQTKSGHFFNAISYYSGTTGGTRNEVNIYTGGTLSGAPQYCLEPCVYSGRAWAVAGFATTSRGLWYMDEFESGWTGVSGVSGGSGGCTALNGAVYYARTSGSIAPYYVLIYKYDIATATETLEDSINVGSRGQGQQYWTNNGSSIFLATRGYVFRKDLY